MTGAFPDLNLEPSPLDGLSESLLQEARCNRAGMTLEQRRELLIKQGVTTQEEIDISQEEMAAAQAGTIC